MKRMTKYLVTVAAALGVAGLCTFAVKNDFGLARNMETLINMMRELSIYYVDEIDADNMMTDAAAGMVRRLDPYTVYMPEEEMTDFEFLTTGKYGGVGALIRKKGEGVVIAQPYKGFPADRAGLQIGDRFIEIAGKDARTMTTEQVSSLLKGTPDTKVSIKVEKLLTGEIEEVKLRRERITISGVGYAGFVADSIGYIQHRDFTDGCYEDMREALEGLQERGLKALILDYRNNGGGIMQEAVEIVSMFVPKGTEVVTTRGRTEHKTYRTQIEPIARDLPVVALVNDGSASAAEIVAGALQDLDRAVLIGQRTFGKGLVQTTRPLGYNNFLKVTTAKYYIPSGRCIQAVDYSSRDEKGAVKNVPDSLIREFRTSGGRKVYDGGGIMPDVRCEPQYISRFAMTLYAMGYIDDYADLYFREHGMREFDPRTFTLTDADYDRFVSFMADKEVKYESDTRRALNQIKAAAKADLYEESLADEIGAIESGLRDDKETNLQTYKKEILETLNNAVILRYCYADGVTEHTLVSDSEVHRAVELLNDPDEYARILREADTVRK
ncbi:S41 family peptidase [uncultured Alistipes sp.]|uniref:S41 family peptidase n=1 Tax=uncultured Alistipes sp. TaxID=538949 RepID=UPI002630E538|nr:S41 family peptidase [uncultured Alistipes sp.]